MTIPSFTQRELEKAIGVHLLPLRESWEKTHPKIQAWENVFQYHLEQKHELFQAEQKEKDNRNTFVLVQSKNYSYTGMWVNLDNQYDTAILSHNYQNALKIVDKQLEGSSERADYLFDKAYALSGLKRYQEAIEYYDKTLSAEPNNTDAIQNKAVNLAFLGRPDEAEQYHNKVLEIDPNHLSANISKLHYLAEKGQGEAYNAQLEKIVNMNPKDIGDRLILAGFKKEKDMQASHNVNKQNGSSFSNNSLTPVLMPI